MARPGCRRMGVPRARATRSAAVAATLSFFLPGAGQAYARDWSRALFFALPTLLALWLLLGELGQGLGHLAGRLLDPLIGVLVLVALVLFGLWRAWSVYHAWRIAHRTRAGWLVLPLLLSLIFGMHGLAVVNTASMIGAGDRIASGGDSLLEPVPIGTAGTPLPGLGVLPDPTPTDPPAASGPTPAPTLPGPTIDPSTDEDPYNEDEGEEPEPTIVEGPAPAYDVALIDTRTDGLLNVLIVGIDWRPGRQSRRTDTMMVVSVSTDTGAVRMFSFPRDIAQFPIYTGGTYHGKLNSFAGYANRNPSHFPEGGMKSLAHQLGYLLGVPIDYYAAVDIPGFETVVKAAGGVTIDNAKEIRDTYIDGGKGFYLPAGKHRLNAAETVRYVRSRHGSSDFARARRQQQVLSALRREMTRPENLARLPTLVDAVASVLRTDFPRDRLDELIRLSEMVDDEATDSYVFRQPDWATFTARTATTRSITALRIDRLRALSIELFGEKSLYNR